MEKNIKLILPNIKQYINFFSENEKSAFPFVIIITMTALLFYNNSIVVSAQKKAYESYKIADELRDSSEDLTKYARAFVATGDPRYEEAFWQVLNVRNGKTVRPDGRKIPLSVLMKQLGFTNNELEILNESQAISDKLVKRELMAINAAKGIYDVNISKLIKPNESKRDFAIRVLNDESYNNDKASIMNPLNNILQLVDVRTQIELMNYNFFNIIFIFISFFIVMLLFIRFVFLINRIKQHIEREKVISKIVGIMRSSIGIISVRNEVISEIETFLMADKVFFVDYDFVNFNFSISEGSESKASKNVSSYAENDMEITQGIVEAMKKFPLRGKDLIFSDLDKYIEENDINEPGIETIFRDRGFIAMMTMPINYGAFYYGDIVVTFEKKRKIKEDDISFVRTLADQAGIVIHQSELYQKIQFQAEREGLLRKIFETIRSSLDFNIVKNTIVNEVGKALNADRCFIWDYDKSTDIFMVDQSSEYRSSDAVNSLIGINSKEQNINWLTDFYKLGNQVLFNNVKQFIKENNLEGSPVEQYFKKYNTKANYSIPIFKSHEILGSLIVQYTKDYEVLSQENIDFLRVLAVQAGEAMYHSKLYKQIQLQTEREKLIANIITKSISTFDITQIKHMVKDVGIITKADRCYFVEVDLENMKGKPIDYDGEYLASSDIKSIIGYDFPTEDVKKFIETVLERKDISVFDYEEIIKDESEQYAGPKRYASLFGLKNSIGIPFYYMNNLTAVLVIEYLRVKTIPSADEIAFLRILGNQVGLAFRQIQNYQNTLKIAEHEKSLRKIMMDSVSIFDTTEVIKLMIVEAGKLLKADRCFFAKFDIENDAILPASEYSEYLATKDIESLFSKPITKDETDAFITELKRKEIVIVEDVNKIELPEITKKMLKDKFSVKSYLRLPVYYKNTVFGALVLHYVQDFRQFTQDEIDVAMAIANQSAIVLHQTELHSINPKHKE